MRIRVNIHMYIYIYIYTNKTYNKYIYYVCLFIYYKAATSVVSDGKFHMDGYWKLVDSSLGKDSSTWLNKLVISGIPTRAP